MRKFAKTCDEMLFTKVISGCVEMHRLVVPVVVDRAGAAGGDVHGAHVVQHVARQLIQSLGRTDFLSNMKIL